MDLDTEPAEPHIVIHTDEMNGVEVTPVTSGPAPATLPTSTRKDSSAPPPADPTPAVPITPHVIQIKIVLEEPKDKPPPHPHQNGFHDEDTHPRSSMLNLHDASKHGPVPWYKQAAQGVNRYFKRFPGQHMHTPRLVPWVQILLGFIGSFIGIGVPALININLFKERLSDSDLMFIIAPFGASAVLLYSAPHSDFAQPRAVLGGHTVAALVGVSLRKGWNYSLDYEWILYALAVSLTITGQNLTKTLHPPGGATALVSVILSWDTQHLGYLFVVWVMAGISVMIGIAVLTNNLSGQTKYPKFWY